MQLQINKRSGKSVGAVNVPKDATVEDLRSTFYSTFHYYPERQRWYNSKTNSVLKEGTLESNGIADGSTLFFKDLGVQISWRLVFVLEYFGPLWIAPLFYFFPGVIYGELNPQRCLVQKVALFLIIFHYFKREMESLFVHRFSNGTMPIVRLPINCGHYWGLFGSLVSYFVFHPKYLPPWTDMEAPIIYFLASLFLLFEILNFKTHIILRNLRPRGTKTRGIPRGWGFDQVSCANYLWEVCCWVTFSIVVRTATAWVFTIVSLAQMAQWALKKHNNYKKQFSDYPKNRKAIFPYIL